MSCMTEKKESNKVCSGCCHNCKNKKIEGNVALVSIKANRSENKHEK